MASAAGKPKVAEREAEISVTSASRPTSCGSTFTPRIGCEVIVSASDDRTVRVWDAATGQPIGEPLTGHSYGVRRVAIGRIGDRDVIVSASHDNTLRIWDLAVGRSLVIDLLGRVITAAFAEDGRSPCASAGQAICVFEV
jgi:WD40 repeat protein